jgi:hypothetical protein
MACGRLLQDAFYLLFLAVAGMVMAMVLNWRNDSRATGMNGTLIAVADIPFVLFPLTVQTFSFAVLTVARGRKPYPAFHR